MTATRILMAACACLPLACPADEAVQRSSSMEPTIKRNESVEFNPKAYKTTAPGRWDVVVFSSPVGSGLWCSRVVGLPGEIIDLTPSGLTINGTPVLPPKQLGLPAYKQPDPNTAPPPVKFPYAVPKHCVFVMGDNVSNSRDSRYWGGLDITKIRGKVGGGLP